MVKCVRCGTIASRSDIFHKGKIKSNFPLGGDTLRIYRYYIPVCVLCFNRFNEWDKHSLKSWFLPLICVFSPIFILCGIYGMFNAGNQFSRIVAIVLLVIGATSLSPVVVKGTLHSISKSNPCKYIRVIGNKTIMIRPESSKKWFPLEVFQGQS